MGQQLCGADYADSVGFVQVLVLLLWKVIRIHPMCTEIAPKTQNIHNTRVIDSVKAACKMFRQ